MKRRCSGWFGRYRCPLPGNWRVTGLGGSIPVCVLHARRWRKAKGYRITRNDW